MKKKTKAAEIPYQEIPDKYRLLCKMHIYEKGENRFILDYRLKNSDGVCIKHSTKSFADKPAAELAMEKLRVEHALAMYKQDNPGCRMTFIEVCEEYLNSRARKDKPGTIVNRLSILNSRVLPFFGDMQIQDIGADDIDEWHDRFRNDDGTFMFSDTYLRSLHSRLSAVLNFSVARGYIESNPAKFIKIGEKNAPERPVWDVSEYRAFKKAIEDKPLACLGYAGVFGWDKKWKVLCGTTLAVLIRIAGHVLSGVLFYSQNAWDGWGAWGYSLAYNLSSRLPEGILSIVIVTLLPLSLLRKTAAPQGGKT